MGKTNIRSVKDSLSILTRLFFFEFFDTIRARFHQPTPIVGNIYMNLKISLLTCTQFVHTLKYGISMGQQKSESKYKEA